MTLRRSVRPPGGRQLLARAIAAEKRAGPSVNAYASRLYDWLFVFVGPVAVVFGVLAISWGFWLGGAIVLLGALMSVPGYRRFARWIKAR
jgi:hypothetical protein